MVQNSLSNPTNELKVTYDSNGETVNLSPSIVRNYLTSSPNVTDQEVMMFISLCKFQHLNPFLREAYLVKYGSAPATLITGKDVFIKRARKQKDFGGFQAGVIVWDEVKGIMEREGTFYDGENEQLIGGWAKVFVKGCEVPFYASVSLNEYQGLKSDGTPNGQWSSKPATMIRKVALSQALREAYPIETAGLYEAEEMGVEPVPDTAPVQAPEPTPAPAPKPRGKKTEAVPAVEEFVPEEPVEPTDEPVYPENIEDLLFGGNEEQ